MATMVNRQYWWIEDDSQLHRAIVTAQNCEAGTLTLLLEAGRRVEVGASEPLYDINRDDSSQALYARLEIINDQRRDNCGACCGTGIIEDYEGKWRCSHCEPLEMEW